MHVSRQFLVPVLLATLGGACGNAAASPDVTAVADAAARTDVSRADTPSDDATTSADAATGEVGAGESRYLAAVTSLTQAIDTADCRALTTLKSDYDSYFPTMTNERYRGLASGRFRPVVDFMARKRCNTYGVEGDAAAYRTAALGDSPAAAYLSGTPLLQAIVDRSTEVDGLLATANAERSAQGLDPIIVAEYPNSIVGGPTSTIVFFPGWPGRPQLHQWVQIQRTIGQMFFVTLQPRSDGRYDSFLHGRALTTRGGATTVGTTFENGTCLQCHYSGRPIHMRALDDATQAARVRALVEYLEDYPAQTNHPEYNPFPSSPGIGTGGKLTLDEAVAYTGRSLTTTELATLNRNTACDSCHDGTVQNPLRPPFDETVDIVMRNGIMPPGGGAVDATERAEAIRVMIAAYKVRMRRYFLGEE